MAQSFLRRIIYGFDKLLAWVNGLVSSHNLDKHAHENGFDHNIYLHEKSILDVHSLEMMPSSNSEGDHGGFIDFHYNGSSSDYTTRIIEGNNSNLIIESKNNPTLLVVSGGGDSVGYKIRNQTVDFETFTKNGTSLSNISSKQIDIYNFCVGRDKNNKLVAEEGIDLLYGTYKVDGTNYSNINIAKWYVNIRNPYDDTKLGATISLCSYVDPNDKTTSVKWLTTNAILQDVTCVDPVGAKHVANKKYVDNKFTNLTITQSQVSGLISALNGKSPTTHTHSASSLGVVGFPDYANARNITTAIKNIGNSTPHSKIKPYANCTSTDSSGITWKEYTFSENGWIFIFTDAYMAVYINRRIVYSQSDAGRINEVIIPVKVNDKLSYSTSSGGSISLVMFYPMR